MSIATQSGQTFVGTSGWIHPDWRGSFYPAHLAVRDWLGFYAQRFRWVEIGAPPRRLSAERASDEWRRQVGEDFRFSIRAPQGITHTRKLRNTAAERERLFAWAELLGERIGPIVFQLPQRWRCNVRRLAEFLDQLPGDHRYVFVFPDPSWHTEPVWILLEAHRAAFALTEPRDEVGDRAENAAGNESSPLPVTADFVYVRLGPAPGPGGVYTAATLRAWAGRALAWNGQGKDVHLCCQGPGVAAFKNARRVQRFLTESAMYHGQVPARAES